VKASAQTVLVALVALICWASAAGSAAAHTALTGSDPADGATVGTPPAVVTLTFTGAISPMFATVAITDKNGRNWVAGAPTVTGAQLRASVSPDLHDGGVYTVGYRVVSADGHPVSGSVAFTVTGASVPSAPPSSIAVAPPSTTVETPTAEAPAGMDTKTSIITAGALGLLLGGIIAFWQSRRHKRKYLPLDDPPKS
jgi:methionine-rich copper-binding protein CopC